MTTSPVPYYAIARLCDQADEQGFEPVSIIPFGVMAAKKSVLIPGVNNQINQIPVYIVLFRKEYDENSKRPDTFNFTLGDDPKSVDKPDEEKQS